MLTIIFAVVLGILFTFVSVNNSQVVSLNLIDNSFSFPLYIIISISFLIGTLVTGIVAFIGMTGDAIDTRKKESDYKNTLNINEKLRNDILRLNNEILTMKKENNVLKTEIRDKNFREKKDNIKEFFSKIAHPGNSSAPSKAPA